MVKIEATEARKGFSELISKVHYGADRVLIARRGKEMVAVVSLADLRLLEMIEDRIDIEAARKVLENPKNKRVPWAKVKADLGL